MSDGGMTTVTDAGSDLLNQCRDRWYAGDWDDLCLIPENQIVSDPYRDRIAVLVATAHAQIGDIKAARHFTRLAQAWGCSRRLMAQVMISSVQNSLARSAYCLEETETAEALFRDAIALVSPGAETDDLAKARQQREIIRMGFLPQAARALDQEHKKLGLSPDEHANRLRMMASDIELLKHELSIALQRRQIYEGEASPPRDTLENRAVSQLGQELWVLEKTEHKTGGFFVEFGATDGVTLSNSWLLEKEFDWQGICAEPNPKFMTALRQNRDCQISDACIAGKTGETVEFILADVFGGIADFAGADMHSDKRASYQAEGNVLHLTTISLDDFLTDMGAPAGIDYLSIDTEGSEYDILASFPFDKWKIRLITVEHNYSPLRAKIRTLLEANGYRLDTEKAFDDWYVLQEA